MTILWILVALLILVVVLALAFLALNYRYKKTNRYKNQLDFINVIPKQSAVPKDLEVINLGSVFGRFAYSYSSLGMKGYNFAQSPQSLAYDFRILKQFTPHIASEAVIFISLPIFIFAFIDYNNKYARHNYKYYHYLDKEYLHQYNPILKFLVTHLPLFSDLRGGVAILRDEKREDPCDALYGNLTPEQVDKQVDAQLGGWKTQFNLNDFQVPQISEKTGVCMEYTTALLSEMIAYCIDHSWKPVLVTTPMSSVFAYNFSDAFLKVYLYDNIAKANSKNVPYVDFTNHPDFANPELYQNGITYLANKGREQFMQLLIDTLRDDYSIILK